MSVRPAIVCHIESCPLSRATLSLRGYTHRTSTQAGINRTVRRVLVPGPSLGRGSKGPGPARAASGRARGIGHRLTDLAICIRRLTQWPSAIRPGPGDGFHDRRHHSTLCAQSNSNVQKKVMSTVRFTVTGYTKKEIRRNAFLNQECQKNDPAEVMVCTNSIQLIFLSAWRCCDRRDAWYVKGLTGPMYTKGTTLLFTIGPDVRM